MATTVQKMCPHGPGCWFLYNGNCRDLHSELEHEAVDTRKALEKKPSTKLCHFGLNCRNILKCTFVHHPIEIKAVKDWEERKVAATDSTCSDSSSVSSSEKKVRDCTFGNDCKKKYCRFDHPDGQRRPWGPCRNGMNCTWKNCRYDHPFVVEAKDEEEFDVRKFAHLNLSEEDTSEWN